MTPERWRQITEAFDAALALEAGQREAYLREVAVADPALGRELESLLAAHRHAGDFGNTPLSSWSLLQPGSMVGPYQVAGLIGVGGMGEVYRARDPRLERDVALKVLPSQFTDDPERLAAFEREARLLASLNHPHIGAIYGLENTDDPSSRGRALVMEFVDGEDLSERIARGPIGVPEALLIASQISEALEAAHEQGIIHRDLKPSNIKVRGDGTVKLIDFGLAKVLESAARATAPIPVPGAVELEAKTFGTAAYMSPERAQGKPSDQRSDIWAFGVVLHEMFTGRSLFTGSDASGDLADGHGARPRSERAPINGSRVSLQTDRPVPDQESAVSAAGHRGGPHRHRTDTRGVGARAALDRAIGLLIGQRRGARLCGSQPAQLRSLRCCFVAAVAGAGSAIGAAADQRGTRRRCRPGDRCHRRGLGHRSFTGWPVGRVRGDAGRRWAATDLHSPA